MARISYKRHRFPPTVIQHAVWLYFRFTLSLRDVEEMMAHRGVDVSYETIRAWTVTVRSDRPYGGGDKGHSGWIGADRVRLSIVDAIPPCPTIGP